MSQNGPTATFAPVLAGLGAAALAERSRTASDADVDRALGGWGGPSRQAERADHGRSLADLAALLSPAAARRLEELALAARAVTLRRFGRTVHLFAPLYVSNECLSSCTYCGFAKGLPIVRHTVSDDELRSEVRFLADQGFRHLLLVSGEHRRIVSPEYLERCVRIAAEFMPSVAIETQTWDEPVYRRLVEAGADGVVIYQETYNRETYAEVHRLGWKRNFDRRLAAVEQAGRAGARRLGLGALMGLHPDWREDVIALAAHARHLVKQFWRAEVTVALPRLKPSAAGYQPRNPMTDAELVQAVCALRLTLPDVGIVLSTREAPALRDGLARIGVTHMSAGSRTEPGGYLHPREATEQFEISDHRTPAEVAAMLRAAGYDPVWKDWERV